MKLKLKLYSKIKQWLFGKKVACGELDQQRTQPEKTEYNMYQGIDDIPLYIFIDCLVDNNTTRLVKSGAIPDALDLHERWLNILIDYNDAVGNNETKLMLQISKEISVLECKLKYIHAAITVLEFDYNEDLAIFLNLVCNTRYSFNDGNKIKDLKSCLNRSKQFKIQLDLKKLRYAGILDKQDKGEKSTPTRAFFTGALIAISNHAKFHITDMITVREYCERLKQYNAYYEQLKLAK